VHPLGVIIAIAVGVILGGIAGALVAVPLAAAGNAVVVHLADRTRAEREARQEPMGDPPDPTPSGSL
jgi:predicted PurR-regulated permease PerM